MDDQRDSKDITQLMKWMERPEIRRDEQVFVKSCLNLMDEIQYALNRLKGEVKECELYFLQAEDLEDG